MTEKDFRDRVYSGWCEFSRALTTIGAEQRRICSKLSLGAWQQGQWLELGSFVIF